nr:MAG TPA: hypothetical protein [Caudoviricetes sp.]
MADEEFLSRALFTLFYEWHSRCIIQQLERKHYGSKFKGYRHF